MSNLSTKLMQVLAEKQSIEDVINKLHKIEFSSFLRYAKHISRAELPVIAATNFILTNFLFVYHFSLFFILQLT